MKIAKFFILLFTISLNSCANFDAIIVRSTSGILSRASVVIFKENDLEKARISIPSNISLLETFLESDPENEDILLLLTQAYVGYALGFVEDENPERAKILYSKGRDYGLKIIMKDKAISNFWDLDEENFTAEFKKVPKKYLPVVFWVSNAWGNLINLSIDDPITLVDLYKVNAMMKFVEQNDEKYFYGSSHLYFGTILATTPQILGGDIKGAKTHFDKCLKIGDRKFLLPFYFYAKSYAVQVQDKELFENLLNEVISAPNDILPEQSLINLIAKEKAKALLSKKDELF